MLRPRLEPRPGLVGMWDRVIGPGATISESTLTIVWMLACTIAVVGYALVTDLGWSFVQLAVVALITLDVAGGVSDNASNSAKRWFHRPGHGARQHLTFVLAHIHPFVLALLFPAFGWGAAAGLYAYLISSALVIVLVPLYLKRPVAFVLYCGALLIGLYVFNFPPGLEWFVPFFFMKLLLAHLLPEAAYRPETEEA